VCLSCSRKGCEQVEYAIKAIESNDRVLDTCTIKEIYYPCDIYTLGNDILVINRDNNDKVIYRYDTEMSFKEAFFSYGRAGNEFSFVGNYLKYGNDSTLYLYTNWFNCTEFSLDNNGITVTDNFHILNEVQNNVILLNDSLLFYRALLNDDPFHVYNYVTDEVVCGFGEFPGSSIIPETDADRDNICLCNSVYDVSGKKLVSFYESIPIIRIYDMETYDLIREIRIVDSEKQITSLDDYYEEEGFIYFLRPILIGKYIYSLYLNVKSNSNVEKTVLVKMDLNGNIITTFTLDRFCPVYTVSEDGMFYGISVLNDEYFFCKTKL
jgi:hypothetical protein